ncbi:hypothetical protein GCM10022393_12700 [Aquimarina addita]|uniref:Uncharacterized protein n=1 Tax=Aquimarina addita TaxID=870485 RepID=A0ABP7XF45_9FLAO
MIIIYNNSGILVPVYIGVSLIVTTLLNRILKHYIALVSALNYDSQIVMGLGLIISAIWTYVTSEDYIIIDGEKEYI